MRINFNERLYIEQIKEICKTMNIPLHGIDARDAMPTKLPDGNYVLNLDSKHGRGTHWTVFTKQNGYVYYFNSFGAPPPQNQVTIFEKNKQVSGRPQC